MNWQQLLIDGYNRIQDSMERTLNGLTQEELDRQPKPDANSIGWLCWHLTRGQDKGIVYLSMNGTPSSTAPPTRMTPALNIRRSRLPRSSRRSQKRS